MRPLHIIMALGVVALAGCDYGAHAEAVLGELIDPLFILLTAVVGVFARSVVRLIAAKLKAEDSIEAKRAEELLDQAARRSISFAEQQARNHVRKHDELPESAQKLAWAIAYFRRQMEANGVFDMAEDFIVDRIEALLGDDEEPGDSHRAMSRMIALQGPIAAALLFGTLALGGLAGCGQSAIGTAGSFMAGWSEAHAGAVELISDEITADLVEHCTEAADTDACLDARAEHWVPLRDAVATAAAAQDAAEVAVSAWAEHATDPDAPPPLETCRVIERSLLATMEAVRLARTLGVDVPFPETGRLTWEC